MNQDLETIGPMLSPQATPDEVQTGLFRLEKTLDYVAVESARVYREHPDLPQQAGMIEEKLQKEFDRLATNIENTARAVRFWYKKAGKKKEIGASMKRIGRKLQIISAQTQRD